MGKPKKSTTLRRTRSRRSHDVVKLARKVNATSPVKAYTTKRESAKKSVVTVTAVAEKTEKKSIAKKSTEKSAE